MDTNINFTNDLNGESDVKTSFNLPRKIYNLTAGRAVADGAIVVESESCTYETMLNIDRTRLLNEASLLLLPNTYKEGKLYSHKPLNGNGDFTATRATTATRVNSAGLVDLVPYNLVQQSEVFSNAYWVKTNSSISANVTTAPDGTLTADKLVENTTSTSHQVLSSSNSVVNGATYTSSIYAKASERNWLLVIYFDGTTVRGRYFDLANGVGGSNWPGTPVTNTITSVGNGWYRITLTFAATSNACTLGYYLANADNSNIYTGDGTSGVFIWGAQLVEGTSARDYLSTETRLNIPRIDYSLGGCPNILLEPQRTNVFLNSVFSGSGATPTSWTQPVGTGTSVLTTSTLGVGAQACSQSATNQRPFLSQNFTLLANTTYSYSIYIESISGALSNDQVLLASGLPVGATTSYFANGVSVSNSALAVVGRLSVNVVVSAIGGSVAFRCGIGTSSNQTGTLLFSRPQLEAGAYATSYIPTTTASVTRNADTITRNNIFTNGLITAAGGTWFVELRNNRVYTRDTSANGLSLNSVSGGNFQIRAGAAPARILILKTDLGVNSIIYTTLTDTVKIAIKWNGSTADVFVNGVKVVSATAFNTTLLQELAAAGGDVPKYINEMALFPTPLTDAQMSMLTSGIYPTAAAAYASLGLVSESPSCLTSTTTF